MTMNPLLLIPSCLALVAAAPAQITPVPLTGCNHVNNVGFSGPPITGTALTMTVHAPPNDFSVLFMGDLMQPGTPLNPPLSCPENTNCSVDVAPAAVFSTQGNLVATLAIPSSPTFVGVCFHVQGGWLDMPRGCIVTGRAIRVCIQ